MWRSFQRHKDPFAATLFPRAQRETNISAPIILARVWFCLLCWWIRWWEAAFCIVFPKLSGHHVGSIKFGTPMGSFEKLGDGMVFPSVSPKHPWFSMCNLVRSSTTAWSSNLQPLDSSEKNHGCGATGVSSVSSPNPPTLCWKWGKLSEVSSFPAHYRC